MKLLVAFASLAWFFIRSPSRSFTPGATQLALSSSRSTAFNDDRSKTSRRFLTASASASSHRRLRKSGAATRLLCGLEAHENSYANSQSSWSVQETTDMEWVSTSILAVDLNDDDLAERLGSFCVALEKEGGGRTVSNSGGFQSQFVAQDKDPALVALLSKVHQPLAVYLQRRYRGQPPPGCRADADLAITGIAEHIWVNVNRPGNSNRLHEHGPPLRCRAASCIYYPLVSSDSPQGSSPRTSPVRFYDGGRMVEVAPRPGLLLLFPTDMPHEVDPYFFGPPRVSMALNLFVRWLDLPLLKAARAGDRDAVRRLASSDVDVNEGDGFLGFRAAHIAAEAGHVDVVEDLVELGADKMLKSVEGWSPLGLAAAQGHLPVVEYLSRDFLGVVDNVPDLFTETDLTKGFASRVDALAVAAERGHQKVVDLLAGSSHSVDDEP